MISSGIDPQLISKQTDARDLVRFKQEMDGLKDRLSGGKDDDTKQLRKACEKFEAVFIGKLWKEMKSTVNKEGYLHSKQEDQYMSMFDREFSEKMAKSGGIGLADMIYDQLSEKLKQTSKDALAGGVRIKPISTEPIALNRGGDPIPLSGQHKGMTLEDWGGAESMGENVVNEVANVAETSAGQIAANRPMTDMDVKAQIETLARRLEVERIKTGLLGTGGSRFGYGQDGEEKAQSQVGRKIAKNG